MSSTAPQRSGLTPRHRLLGAALLATLAASIWALGDDPPEPPPARPKAAGVKLATLTPGVGAADAPRKPAEATPAPFALPERYGLAVARRDLFAATPVVLVSPVKPVAAAASALPAPPAPPPPPAITLPFSFAGRLVTEAGPSVLLNEGSTTRVLALGASLGDFRFEQDNASQLEFVHVPSGEHLVLALQP